MLRHNVIPTEHLKVGLYRPYVSIDFGESGSNLKLEGPLKFSKDNKHRWIKNFKYTTARQDGVVCTFEIFENRNELKEEWAKFFNKLMGGGNNNSPKSVVLKAEWGWLPRNIENKILSKRVNLVESLYLNDVNMQYVEGGLKINVTCTDALGEQKTFKKILNLKFNGKTFMIAIAMLFEHAKRKKYLDENTNFYFDKNFQSNFNLTEKRDWPINGKSLHETIQAWLAMLKPRFPNNKVQSSFAVKIEKNKTIYYFSVIKNDFENAEKLFDNPIHVNLGEPGINPRPGHEVISFSPSFSPIKQYIPKPAVNMADNKTRSAAHSENAINDIAGQSSPLDDSSNLEQDKTNSENSIEKHMSQDSNVPIGAECDLQLFGCVGEKYLAESILSTKTIELIIWNYHRIIRTPLNGYGPSITYWNRTPSQDSIWSRNKYMVIGIEHVIEGGKFTTTLKIVPYGKRTQ